MKGIDKRTHKDGTVSYRARIRIKGHPVLSQSFSSKTRFHDLRHTAASYLAMGQASLLEIGTLLGHKTVQMTKRYAYFSDAHAYTTAAVLNAELFSDKKHESSVDTEQEV